MVLKESQLTELAPGDPAPAFELPGADGDTYALDDFADRAALLVVFTCNHCPYAQAKVAALNRLAERYDDLAVVGINPNDAEEYPEDSLERMRELVEDGTVRYDAYLRDERQEVSRAYGAVCTPDPFLFRNDEGTFRLAYHGRLDDALDPEDEPSGPPGFEMANVVETVLAGGAPDETFRPAQGCSIKWRE